MARGDQLGRQWRIIQTLISSRTGKSAAELSEELECHPRKVYRDLEALQIAGFPIYTERVEGKSLWSLLDTVKHQIPVPFSLTELMALYFSTEMLKVFRDTPFHDSLESLSGKVKATLPPESLNFLQRAEQTLHVGIRPYKDYGRFREILNQVNDAALNRRTVEMVYYTMTRRKETRRRVDSYRVWFFNGTFYLIGKCHLRGEIRIFALGRIRLLHQTKNTFEVPEDFDLEGFLRPALGVFRGEPVRVRIQFSAEAAGFVKEKVWHPSQVLEPQQDGSLLFEAELPITEEVRAWVMGWGAGAQVLGPEALREAVRSEAEAILAGYDGEMVREAEGTYQRPGS